MYAGKRKPGPRRGYARDLLGKVEQLEKSLNSLSSQLQEHLNRPGRSESHSLGQKKLPSGSYDDDSLKSLIAAGTSVQAAEAVEQVEPDEHDILAVSPANTPNNRDRDTTAVSRLLPGLRAVAANGKAESHEYDSFLETAGLPPHHQLGALVDLYFGKRERLAASAGTDIHPWTSLESLTVGRA